MPVRLARYQDLPVISSVFAAAFHEENLHAVFFPYRNEHPHDYVRAWRHHITEEWWNYKKIFAVSYEIDQGREKVTGAAEWMRAGDGWENLWGIRGWWDPRLLILPFMQFYHRVHRLVFRNRASIRPTPARPNPLTYWTWQPAIIPFIVKFFVPPTSSQSTASSKIKANPKITVSGPLVPPSEREVTAEITIAPLPPSPPPNPSTDQSLPHHELCGLGVLPNVQSKGHGRALCAWGLGLARKEDLPAVVLAAEHKERFYQRCGFTNLVGWATEGEGNPLRELGIRGGAILWTGVNGGPKGEEEELTNRGGLVS